MKLVVRKEKTSKEVEIYAYETAEGNIAISVSKSGSGFHFVILLLEKDGTFSRMPNIGYIDHVRSLGFKLDDFGRIIENTEL